MMQSHDSHHGVPPPPNTFYQDVEDGSVPPEEWQPPIASSSFSRHRSSYFDNHSTNKSNAHGSLPTSDEYKVDHPVTRRRSSPKRRSRRRRQSRDNDDAGGNAGSSNGMTCSWKVLLGISFIALVILLPVLLTGSQNNNDSARDPVETSYPQESSTATPSSSTEGEVTTMEPPPQVPNQILSVTDNFQYVNMEEPATLFRVHDPVVIESLMVDLLVPPPELDANGQLLVLSAKHAWLTTGMDCNDITLFSVEHVVTSQNFNSTTVVVKIATDTTLAICANSVVVAVAHHLFLPNQILDDTEQVREIQMINNVRSTIILFDLYR